MKQAKQMTKKEVVDLLAHFSLMAISKDGEKLINENFTEDQVDKMMRVCVNLFNQDNKKAEAFIINTSKRLLKKLEAHDDSECQIKNFKGDKI